jgi:hypothetical protein
MDFSAASVEDVWRYIDEWRDTDDRVVAFGRARGLDAEPPDKKRITEATGNEGATYERS